MATLNHMSKVKKLMKHQEFKDLIDSYIPGFSGDPRIKMTFTLPFKEILPYMTDDVIAKTDEICAAVDALNLEDS